jgi:hypothetical protein
MALIFSQGYMRGNGDPNVDTQIKDGGDKIPKLYIDDLTDSVYGFDGSQASGGKWYKYLAGITSKTTDIKVWLRGPSLGATMRTSLATGSLIPLTEPYEGLGFTRKGFSGEVVANTAVFTTNNITDWILVELRDKDNPEFVLYNRAGLLKNTGEIVDVDGTSPLEFPFIKDFEYYVSVKHRNHLGLMTGSAVDITQTLDLTLLGADLYGPTDNRIEHTGNYAMRAGIVGNRKVLIYSGENGWQANIIRFLGYNLSAVLTSQYSIFDLTMDGTVRYTGGSNDNAAYSTSVNGNISNIFQEYTPPFENTAIYTSEFYYNTFDSSQIAFKTIDATATRVYEERYGGNTSIVLPKGTTAERPSTSLEAGMTRYNTTDNKLEYYNGTVWVQL